MISDEALAIKKHPIRPIDLYETAIKVNLMKLNGNKMTLFMFYFARY